MSVCAPGRCGGRRPSEQGLVRHTYPVNDLVECLGHRVESMLDLRLRSKVMKAKESQSDVEKQEANGS